MPSFHAPLALLPDGWARDVLLTADDDGTLTRIESGRDPLGEAEALQGVAVPGVPNLHSHAFQRALAGLAETPGPRGEDDFWSWRSRMYAFLERLEPDDVRAVASQLYTELLRSGYTTVAEFHYLHNAPDGAPYADRAIMSRALLEAAEDTGIGITLLPVLYAHGGFGGAAPEAGQRRFVLRVEDILGLLEALTPQVSDLPDARLGLALHSLRAVTPEELARAVDGARRLRRDLPVHIHAAEQEREVEACLAWSGARPVRWLLDHAPVDETWCLVHATHLDDGEVRDLAASGAVAGLCPTTEANLGDGIFPFPDFHTRGGRWGVGSDSHVATSPARELQLLEYGQRLVLGRRNVAGEGGGGSTGGALFRGALAGGAAACGRPVGRLAPGARADLVVLDPDHPSLVRREDDALLDGWVFAAEASPVRDVLVGGRWRVRDGRHPQEEAIADRYRNTLARLLA